jgi:hypothetical protein
MIALLYFILAVVVSPLKSKSRLEAENAALRYQLIVLRRIEAPRYLIRDRDCIYGTIVHADCTLWAFATSPSHQRRLDRTVLPNG